MADDDNDGELYDDSHLPGFASHGPPNLEVCNRVLMECREAYLRLHPEETPKGFNWTSIAGPTKG